MPPWFADPHYGHFSNDRRLSDADIAKLAAWVDAGAPECDPSDKPAPLAWTAGWSIKPDVVFEMPKPYTVPKDGTIEYTYFVVPSGFTQDTWVTDAEIRPGNRAVVHHVSVYVRPPGSAWMKDAKPGEAYVPPKRGPGGVSLPTAREAESRVNANEWFVGYVPGITPQRYFAPEMGAAKLIPAGSDLVFEMHYTANGKAPGDDQSKVGFILAKEPPKFRLLTLGVADASFAIPPGDANYEGRASATFNQPVTVIYLGIIYINTLGSNVYNSHLFAAAHAHARKRHGDALRVSHWGIRDHAQGAQLQLPVADDLLRAGTAPSAQGHARAGHRALGQFGEQSPESRSHGNGSLGRPELG